MEVDWDSKLIAELNQITRKYVFDWEKIASHLCSLIDSENIEVLVRPSPEICRKTFAQFNSVQLPEEANTEIVQLISVENGGKNAELTVKYEDLSLEQLIETVEKNEQLLKKRKEEIFQRVLDSLGGDGDTIQLLADPAITAYQESLRKKELLEKQKKAKEEEVLERAKLEKERDQLKRRFDPDSIDSVGEYPESLRMERIIETEAKLESHVILSQQEEYSFVGNFSIESLVGHEEFDRILSELEKELDAQAIGKDEGNISELGEVLQFLEISASETEKAKLVRSKEIAETLFEVKPPPPIARSPPVDQTVKEETRTVGKTQDIFPKANVYQRKSTAKAEIESKRSEISDDEGDVDSDDEEEWTRQRSKMKISSVQISTAQPEFDHRPIASEKNLSQHVESLSVSSDKIDVAKEEQKTDVDTHVVSVFPAPSPKIDFAPNNVVSTSQHHEDPAIPEIPKENQEIIQKTEIILEEIMPIIDAHAVPEASGSLLNARRTKGKKK